MITGTGTARSGSASLSLRGSVTRKVWASTASNCSGFSSEPAFIWKVGKPPTLTARSKDHLTSAAVTGVPSWKRACLRSLNVMERRSGATCQLSASSGWMTEKS